MALPKRDPADYILYYNSLDSSKSVFISTYEEWTKKNDISSISQFVYDRLYSRYLKIFDFKDNNFRSHFVSGFAIMANCCLLIETIESFYRGWHNSDGKSESAFLKFFTRDSNFSKFAHSDFPSIFYKSIRCSILHQGETSGGWKISCKNSKEPVDIMATTVYAFRFHNVLKKSLENYHKELLKCDWDTNIWCSLRNKMKTVIINCKRENKKALA